MCNLIGHAVRASAYAPWLHCGKRRGASLIAPMMCSAVAGDGSIDTRIQVAQLSGDAGNSRTRLILLGTAGGPTWWLNSDQCGISSLVAVGDAYYLVDCGEGVGKRLRQAISPANSRCYERQHESALPDPPPFRSYSRLCESVAVRIVHRARSPILTLQGLWSGSARPNGTCFFSYPALRLRLCQSSIPKIRRLAPGI